MTAREELVLLYDGLCGFCDRAVQFIVARDHAGTMKFAPLQGEYARALFAQHPELARIDSLVLVRTAANGEHEIFVRSDAVVAIARYLGGIWNLAAFLLRVVPRFLRDFAYDRFAVVRFRIFGRRDSCRIPDGDLRVRFLD